MAADWTLCEWKDHGVISCYRVGKKIQQKILGSSVSVKYLGLQGFGGCQDIPSKVKAKLLPLAPPTTKKEAQHVVGLLRL